MLDCLGHCTSRLESVSRQIILRYYEGEVRVKIENRRCLAKSLGITINALSIRACRIRDKLGSLRQKMCKRNSEMIFRFCLILGEMSFRLEITMNEQKFNQQKLNAYLLGALPETEAERFDELSFTNDEFAEELRSAENDLVDAYAGGELSGAELEKFNARYLVSPLRAEKVEFAKNFRIYSQKNNAFEAAEISQAEFEIKQSEEGFLAGVFANLRFWRMGFAAAAFALVITGGWLLIENSRLRNRFDQSLARQTELERRETQLLKEVAVQSSGSAEKETELARIREELTRLEKKREQQAAERQERKKEMHDAQQKTETTKNDHRAATSLFSRWQRRFAEAAICQRFLCRNAYVR